MQGWIKLHRKIQEHWLFQESREMTKLEAWLTILLEVNHKAHKVLIKGRLYDVNKGESVNSLQTWAKRFRWTKSKTRRFMSLLQDDNMIVLKTDTKTTRLTVCNYDSYQVERNANETETKHKRNTNETQTNTNKNEKKEENEKNDKNSLNKASDFNDDYKPPSMKVVDQLEITDEQIEAIQNNFELWFKEYGVNSAKEIAKREWSMLTDKERKKCLEVVQDYVQNTEKRYRKKPNNYLSNKAFNDEIINRKQKQGQNEFIESAKETYDSFIKGEWDLDD